MVRNAMRFLDMHDLCISYDADLPARSGLGGSSFAVGLLNAFHALKGQYANNEQLAKEAIYVERVLCAEAGGWQDQIAAAYGGMNRISFGPDGFEVSPVMIQKERRDSYRSALSLNTAAGIVVELIEGGRQDIPLILNICGDDALSKYDIGLMIAEKLQVPSELIRPISILDNSGVFEAKRVSSTLMSSKRPKDILGISETKLTL